MPVTQERRAICEPGFGRGNRGYGWRDGLRPFEDVIPPLGAHPGNPGPLAAAPRHFQHHLPVGVARGKNPERVTSRKIASSADHFLGLLRHRPPKQFQPGADSAGIAAGSMNPHRHPGHRTLVAQHDTRTIQSVDHHIQVAIPIEVPGRNALVHSQLAGAPDVGAILKTECAPVAEGDDGLLERGIEPGMLHQLAHKLFLAPCGIDAPRPRVLQGADSRGGVQILHIAPVP